MSKVEGLMERRRAKYGLCYHDNQPGYHILCSISVTIVSNYLMPIYFGGGR